jgi:tRNA threonylcarbamoyladenosine biosynthesis protein TsaE
MNFVIHSHSPEATRAAGERLGRQLRGDELLLIHGELGAGKTQFVKGVAAGLGVPADDVVSPSYVLMIPHRGNRGTLYHFDLYRLGERAEQSGLDEAIGQGVVAVEWAQYLDERYRTLSEAVAIEISSAGAEERTISVQSRLEHIREP